MKNENLGIDLDGVVYDWEGTVRFLLKHYFGYDLRPSMSWGYIENSVSKEHWDWIWNEGITKHGIFRHGHCIRGAHEALRHLSERGHNIHIITSRPKIAWDDTKKWLDFHRVRYTTANLAPEASDKFEIATKLGVSVMLDDKPSTVKEFSNKGLRGILFTQTHNIGASHQPRVADWDGFVKLVAE